jgi:hypothetical protein
MNTTFKALRWALAAGFLGTAGCMAYPGDYAVEISGSPYAGTSYGGVESCGSSCAPYLDIELSWDSGFPGCSNLDLALLTPSYDWVTASSDGWGGCFHMGDDPGDGGAGYEEIICDRPESGRYEIDVLNDLCHASSATLSFRQIGGRRDFADFRQLLDLNPGETIGISVDVQ